MSGWLISLGGASRSDAAGRWGALVEPQGAGLANGGQWLELQLALGDNHRFAAHLDALDLLRRPADAGVEG